MKPWILLALLFFSLQVDIPLSLGSLTVFQNELLLAFVVCSLPFNALALERGRRAWLWALPLMLWLLAHGVVPGPKAEGVKAALRVAQPLCGLALPWLLLRDDKAWTKAAWAALVAMSLTALWAIAQSLTGSGHPLNVGREAEMVHGFQAAAAGMGHHNQLGAALVPGLALLAVMLLRGKQRVWLVGLGLLLGGALLCSFSRGAWLGAMLGLLFLLPLFNRRWLLAVFGLGVVGALVIVLGPWVDLQYRLASLGSDSDRAIFWAALTPALWQHWAWGWGWPEVAAVTQAAAQGLGRDAWATKALSSHAHSVYLQYALAFGLPVLALGALVLARFLAITGLCLRYVKARPYALACIGVFLALALQSATDLLTLHGRGLFPALLCGLLLAGARLQVSNSQR